MELFIPIAITFGFIVGLTVLVVGLTASPWPILLALLVLGIVATQWLINQTVGPTTSEDVASESPTTKKEPVEVPKPTKDKTLVYRGIVYEETDKEDSKVKSQVGRLEVSGNYRGQSWRGSKKIVVKKD